MRKTMLLFCLCIATMAQAQNLRWGITAGAEHVSPTDLNSGWGFQFGVKGEMYFNSSRQGLFLDAALLFDKKKSSSDSYYDTVTKTSSDFNFKPYGITIPVNVGYKFQLSKPVSLYLAAGPYVTIGIDGTYEMIESRYNDNGEKTWTLTADYPAYDYLNRCTAGIGCKVGVELFSHYQISAGYDWALTPMFKNSSSVKSKYRELTLSLSYMF